MKLIFLAIGTLIFLNGCSTMRTPVTNTTDIRNVDFSKALKRGEDCAYYALGFIGPFGDSSLTAAAKAGKISKVEVVDYNDGYYFLFSKNCVVAHGN